MWYSPLSLTNLLGLHSSSVLATEAQLSYGYIVKNDVKVFGSFKQLPAYQQGNLDNKTDQQHLAMELQ